MHERDNRQKMESRQKVCMIQIFESKVNCMKDFMKLSMRTNNLDHLTFYFGTSEIPSKKSAKSITETLNPCYANLDGQSKSQHLVATSLS